MVFIPLNVAVSREHVMRIYSRFVNCRVDECSCIRPILSIFGMETHKRWVLNDLLEDLDQAGQLSDAFAFNLTTLDFELEIYDYDVVEANLIQHQN